MTQRKEIILLIIDFLQSTPPEARLNGGVLIHHERVTETISLKDIFIQSATSRDSFRKFRKRIPEDIFRLDLSGIDLHALQLLALGFGYSEFAKNVKNAQEMLLKSLYRNAMWDNKASKWVDILPIVADTEMRQLEKKRGRSEAVKENNDRYKRLRTKARRGAMR